MILPGAAYTEKHGTYVNTEGRVQRGALRGLSAGRGARGLEDPARLQRSARQALPYDNLDGAARAAGAGEPGLRAPSTSCRASAAPITAGPAGDPAALGDAPFVSPIANYYQTDPISRASPTMAECTGDADASRSPQAAE